MLFQETMNIYVQFGILLDWSTVTLYASLDNIDDCVMDTYRVKRSELSLELVN